MCELCKNWTTVRFCKKLRPAKYGMKNAFDQVDFRSSARASGTFRNEA